ncbi:MAG: hypothetical protein EBR33_13625 [Synechococcaceae bacterium WB4_1_0192]|nr:hypothetical protein [Synechococcaceae bacterium WB4_1_0192]
MAVVNALLEHVMATDVRDLVGHGAAQVADVGSVGPECGPRQHHRAAGCRPALDIAEGMGLADQFIPAVAVVAVGVELGEQIALLRLA